MNADEFFTAHFKTVTSRKQHDILIICFIVIDRTSKRFGSAEPEPSRKGSAERSAEPNLALHFVIGVDETTTLALVKKHHRKINFK